MANLKYLRFLLLICIAQIQECEGVNGVTDLNEFVFALDSWSDVPHVLITTSSHSPVFTSLSVSAFGLEINGNVTQNNPADITLPNNVRMSKGDGKQNKTIIVKASGTVSVHAFSEHFGGGDAFLVLPSSKLGTQHYIASYKPDSHSSAYLFVSATQCNTSVVIKTKHGQEQFVSLTKYESYRFDGWNGFDLTGTFVESNKPVTVISGLNYDTVVPTVGGGQHSGLLDQIPPVKAFGKHFIMMPFLSLITGYLFRILSMNSTTILTFSNGTLIQIEAGEFYEGDEINDIAVAFNVDQPVVVVQFMKSGVQDGILLRGSPAMRIIPPVTSFTNNVTFPVFRYRRDDNPEHTHDYYVNVIAKCPEIEGLVFDDTESMQHWNRLDQPHPMCGIRNIVSTGYHSVSHPDPTAAFDVSVYAICNSTCREHDLWCYGPPRCESAYIYSTRGLPVSKLYLKCQQDVVISPTSGQPNPLVAYTQPVITGGETPYMAECDPPSGNIYGIGTHTITCAVSDASGAMAICTFKVQVNAATDLKQPEPPILRTEGSAVILEFGELPLYVSNVYVSVEFVGGAVRERRQTTFLDFIVANLTRSDTKETMSFTIGDNATYGGYLNRPLTSGQTYTVRVAHASCIPQECAVKWSPLSILQVPDCQQTLCSVREVPNGSVKTSTDSTAGGGVGAYIWFIVGGVVGAIVIITIVTVVVVFIICPRRRKPENQIANVHTLKESPENETYAEIDQNQSARSALPLYIEPLNDYDADKMKSVGYEVNIAMAGMRSAGQVPNDGDDYEDANIKTASDYQELNIDNVEKKHEYQGLGNKQIRVAKPAARM